MLELYLGAIQIGLYLTPINHHLVGPEIAYIVNDSDAKVFVGHERFADELAKAADRDRRCPPTAASRSATIDGLPARAPSCSTASPTTAPDDRIAGAPMHYTSGTTGQPKGVKRGARRHRPRRPRRALRRLPGHVRRAAARRQRAHHRLAALPHRRADVDGQRPAHGPHGRAHGQVDARGRCSQLIDEHKVTTSHMVPTQFHRLLALPEDVRAKYDVLVDCAAWCTPRRRARPTSSAA